jgi:predicted metal-dependent HD superfamily phosphohydrolase
VSPDLKKLRETWDGPFRRLALDPPAGTFEALVARYSEPHRAYHTLQHIAECFGQFAQVTDARSLAAIGIALWFHDAIYDPKASDNEAKSAEWALQVLDASGAAAMKDDVNRLIMATRHDAVPQDRDAQILVDIDLSILGAPPERFAEYENQIRFEYNWVAADAFRSGRTRVLKSFLERPFIFSTDGFRTRLETRARNNLGSAIAALA